MGMPAPGPGHKTTVDKTMKPTTSKMIRKLLPVLIAALIVLTACTGGVEPEGAEQPAGGAGNEVVVGLLFPTLYDPNYVSIQKGAIETASRLNVHLIVRDAGNSSRNQLNQVAEVLALDIDALILVPVDTSTVNSARSEE